MKARQKSPLPLIATLWVSGLLAAGQYAKVSVPFDVMRDTYSGHGAALGFSVSLVSFVGMIFGLLGGIAVVKFGARRALLMAMCLGAGLSLFQATLPSFPMFLVSRCIEGIAHLTIVIAAPLAMVQSVSKEKHHVVMTLWSTFFAVSIAVFSWVLVPLVDGQLSSLFAFHGVALLVVAAVLMVIWPAATASEPVPPLSWTKILNDHMTVYKSAHILTPAAGWLFYTLSFVALATVMPDFFPEYDRSFIAGALPLAALLVTMTLAVSLIGRFGPIRVLMIGFLGAAIGLAGFALDVFALGSTALMFGAMGLVQAGSFSAVAFLNTKPEDQALANGAMAQTGNTGNLIGTPLVLLMIAQFGQVGLVWFGMLTFSAGIGIHVWFAHRRAKLRYHS